MLIDEADTVFGPAARDELGQSLRGLINAGFERGATVGRIVGDGTAMVPKDFSVFSPRRSPGSGRASPTPSSTAPSTYGCVAGTPNEKVEPFRRRRCGSQAEALRRRLGSWAETTVLTIEAAIEGDLKLPAGVEDRQADTWEPLVAVAIAAGGEWPQRAATACELLTSDRTESGTSGQLIADIDKAFQPEEKLFSKTLVERLNAFDESPWGGWNKGDGMQPRDLASQLREFEIRSGNVRIGSEQRKGYERAIRRRLRPLPTPRK